MTTAPVSAPAAIGRAGVPGRRLPASSRQRLSTALLVVGTVMSLASLAGPEWAVRAGSVVALASAVGSCSLAWRELYLTKRRHAQDLLLAGRRHTEDLRAERQHNADVLDTVGERAMRWRQEVDRQQTQIAGLRVEVSALRSDLVSVRRQLVRAGDQVDRLHQTVRERNDEIAALRDVPGVDAELHALPRRGQVDRAQVAVSSGSDTPAVVDFRSHEPALPNFEADRRPA